MEIIFKGMSKVLYLFSLFICLSGVASFLYVETEADDLQAKETVFFQNGYGGGRGFSGGYYKFTILRYSYTTTDDKKFKGIWLKINLRTKPKYDTTLFYNPFLPMLSVKEKGLPIFWIVLLCLLGFIASQISIFFKYLNKHT